MSAVASGALLVPGIIVVPDSHSHSRFPWGFFAGGSLILLGLFLAAGGVVYAVKIRGKARKASEHGPGLLLLLIGAALAVFGFCLV